MLTRWSRWRLFLLASLLLAGCGVPISAADLTLTPEAQPTSVGVVFGQTTLSGRAADVAPALTPRSATVPGPLTTQAPLTPLATSSAGPTRTATVTSTPTPTRTPTPFGTPPPTATATPNTVDLAMAAIEALNKYRIESGRPALRVDPNLMAAAGAYAKQLADAKWFSCACDWHTGPDGSQPEQRMARAGYRGGFRGEAIAGGQASAQDAVVAWLNSPAHAAIALDSTAVDIGVGYYYNPSDFYGHYWVLLTGRP